MGSESRPFLPQCNTPEGNAAVIAFYDQRLRDAAVQLRALEARRTALEEERREQKAQAEAQAEAWARVAAEREMQWKAELQAAKSAQGERRRRRKPAWANA